MDFTLDKPNANEPTRPAQIFQTSWQLLYMQLTVYCFGNKRVRTR